MVLLDLLKAILASAFEDYETEITQYLQLLTNFWTHILVVWMQSRQILLKYVYIRQAKVLFF